jgi:ribosome recycling factor
LLFLGRQFKIRDPEFKDFPGVAMPVDDILLECEEHMEKAVEHLKHELRGIRTGRASPALVEHVQVEYYGAPAALRSIAVISIPEATQILIKPFNPGDLKAIEKGISDSKLGLTAHSDGKSIGLILPSMSQEVRQKMVGQTKTMGEEAKVRIRAARRDANKAADTEEKSGIITEDAVTKVKEDIQELTKTYEGKVDAMLEAKRKEVMET